MQTTSATWKRLWAAGAPLEARATIAGTVYTEIAAPVIHRAAMQERLSVGNVAAASLTMKVRGGAAIPRSAAVAIEVRLNDGTTASEWIPQGTFYVSRRARDPVTGVVALECYDALLKANAVWTPSQGSWPRTMAAVAAELLALLEIELDSRTAIPSGAAFMMSAPAAGTTIREALGTIAQAGGGNWIVTPAGKLRLVPVADAADAGEAEADALDVTGVTGAMDAGTAGTITGVRCTSGGEVTLTGDDSGIVVDVSLTPMIAVEAADLLIGLRYQAYRLTGAICDPAAELGDYVRAGANGEIASALYNWQIALAPACRSEIAAPQAGELTDEYPYIGGSEKVAALAAAAAAQAAQTAVDGLDQQAIFNRLTDNGAAQGLVLYNGQLYVNASYIQAGTLTLGGLNNVNGRLRVLNAVGNEVGKWDNSGLEVKDGAFNATAPGGYVAINAEVVPAIRRALGILWSPSTGDDVLVSIDRGELSITAGGFDGYFIDDGHTNITPGEININGGIYTDYPGITINGNADYGDLYAESTTLYRNGQIRFTDYNGNTYFNLDYLTGMTLQAAITAYGGFVGNVTGNCSGSAGSVAWGNVTDKPANYPGGCTGNAATATTASKCSSANLTNIALTWSGSYSTGSWMLIYNGETGENGGALFRTINCANTAAWVDNEHKWARIGGDTFTGNVHLSGAGDKYFAATNTDTGCRVYLDSDSKSSGGNHGIYSNGYWNGSAFVSNGKWMIYRKQGGDIIVNGSCTGNAANVTGTVAVGHGGTGSTSAGGARTNLGITSGTKVATFSSGKVTLNFSDFGVSSRPSVLMLTAQNANSAIYRYDYDNSTSNIVINAYKPDGSAVANGSHRFCWICIP